MTWLDCRVLVVQQADAANFELCHADGACGWSTADLTMFRLRICRVVEVQGLRLGRSTSDDAHGSRHRHVI